MLASRVRMGSGGKDKFGIIPIANLVAYYNLNNNLLDSSGNNRHGSKNETTIFVEGYNKEGALLQYANDRITIPDIKITGIAPGYPYTYSIWYKRDDIHSSNTFRTLIGSSGNNHPLIIFQGNGKLGAYTTVFEDFDYVVPNDSQWHHYAVILLQKQSLSLYVDGIFHKTISTTLSLNSYPIQTIGNSPIFAYNAGHVDEVGFWDRALTASEINKLYGK